MQTKYTPGPWQVNDWRNPIEVCDGDQGCGTIAIMWQQDKRHTREARANARLIAAAPEMVEMLRDLAEWLDCVELGPAPQGSLNAARALLARIEGGE